MSETQDSRSPALGTFARFFRWLFSWRVLRRWLFVLACLATLVGLFYAEEDWRGKRAWEKVRRELEAKGRVFDWNAFIPGPVLDDQNIFKAPKMTEWFVSASFAEAAGNRPSKSGEATAPFSLSPSWNTKKAPTLLADVDVVPPSAPLPAEKTDAVLRFDQPAAREEAVRLVHECLGPCTKDVWNGLFVAKPLDQIHPLHIVLQADPMPTTGAIAEFLTPSAGPSPAGAMLNRDLLQVERSGSQGFQVSLSPSVRAATEYLAASKPALADVAVLRRALERPYSRIDGDYQRPFDRPIPNFVRMRTVAQLLSQRAKGHLLLGQSEAAWHELALVREMCRMTEAKPASNCPTLVETMIDVAITGLYTMVIQDGLRLHAWREPELAAIQKQLMNVNLLQLLRASFEAEGAYSCRTLEITSPAEQRKLFGFGGGVNGLRDRLKSPAYLLLTFAPRGWMYQNISMGAPFGQMILEGLDASNDQVLPGKFEHLASQLAATASKHFPFAVLSVISMTNFVKATRTTARNQTMVNEALVACGLERYRLAHDHYPESLDTLVPQFAEKVPHDIVGGEPLKYHRTAEGRFVLYSLGWNGKDDGGIAGKGVEEGDWVWQ